MGGFFRGVDVIVIATCWLASYWMRFNLPFFEVTKGFPKFATYAALAPLVVILWMMVFSAMRVYRPRRMLRRTHEAHLLIKSHGVAMLFFIALTYLFSEYKYSRGVMLYFGVSGGFSLVLFRLVLRNSLRVMRRRGYNQKNVLIVGSGGAVDTLKWKIEKFPELGIRISRVLADGFEQVAGIVRSENIDQVLIALPRHQYGELDRILRDLNDEMIEIQLVPDVHEYVTLGCEVEDFDGMPIVQLNDSPLGGWNAVFKRMTDAAVSLLALLVLLPLFAVIALLIKLTSRGPVFYSQDRMGLDGRVFKMVKFRSMKPGSDGGIGAGWTRKDDDRRTRLGSFLRATSMDELPQFWNVFRGDMSLVGPRPEQPFFVQQFKRQIPFYMLRHKVKAGLTGWAQVNGWRGDTSLDKRIECDLYYIKNWSHTLDLKIMFMTVWRGFINKNAY